MELDLVRKELNKYDDAIKTLVTLRMSLIPIVADIKIKNNLPLFQGKREDEIYNKIEIFAEENGADKNLVKDIYKLIIANALEIEGDISNDENKSVINKNIDKEVINDLKEHFEKLDNILGNEIPNTIANIKKVTEKHNLTLTEKATLYYNNKTKQ